MTTLFAFRASPELSESSQRLVENFERKVAEPQSALFVKVAQLFADEIVDALLLNLVRNASSQSSAQSLENFAGIIKSTVNTLIKQVLGKMSNEELRPLSGYIGRRRLVIDRDGESHDHVVFEMPADYHARFRAVLEKGQRGELDEDEMLACMSRFHELALTAFYDESLAAIKLGFIGRKVADMGGAAIRKGAQVMTSRMIPQLQGDDLTHFCGYFLAMLVTV